jgi:5-methylcytosine-specific restriction endonuclease McrA
VNHVVQVWSGIGRSGALRARERYHRLKASPEFRARQRERDAKRWAENPVRRQQCLDRRKRFDQAHPEVERARVRHKEARRRAQIKGGDATVADMRALVANAKRCAICGCRLNGEVHVDHIIPLAAGGRHAITNLRAACPSCNVRRPHDGSDVYQLVIA